MTLETGADVPTTAKAKFCVGERGGVVVVQQCVVVSAGVRGSCERVAAGLDEVICGSASGVYPVAGGNYLEGNTFPTRFDWKKMIGPVDERPGHMGCWNYRSSDGFGLPEYLLWCKQLNAEPVLAVFAGCTLNHDHVKAGPELQKYEDEALEEIEYVSGDASTKWGKQRAADGFPEPFTLHYVEVGNEDFFDNSGSYDGRFAQFFDAIKAKYPQLKVIATTPVKMRKPDLVDDHYYRSAKQMAYDNGHYDKTDRNGPQIFVGSGLRRKGSRRRI